LSDATFTPGPAYRELVELLRPPSPLLLFAEWRSIWELGSCIASLPTLMLAKVGDGHPVLVLPGFLLGDLSTSLLRRYIGWIGYESHGWELGQNVGGVCAMREKLRERLSGIYARREKKVSIVGWSLGGVYARDLARSMPDKVRYVITLGSPLTSDFTASRTSGVYDAVMSRAVGKMRAADRAMLSTKLVVPTTAVFSKSDGIVISQSCLVEEGPLAENIGIRGSSHIGLAVNPAVLWAVADRLAQEEGRFQPFDRLGPFTLAYHS